MCSKKNKHLQALILFERGYGYKATASELNLNTETVREWLYTWKALGSDLYKHPEKRPHSYSAEVKLAAVKDRQKGVPTVEVMKRYQVANRHRIKEWCNLYTHYGETAFEDHLDS